VLGAAILIELFGSIDGGRKRARNCGGPKDRSHAMFVRVRVGVRYLLQFCAFLVLGGLFSSGLDGYGHE
jgi:hypothetical protein